MMCQAGYSLALVNNLPIRASISGILSDRNVDDDEDSDDDVNTDEDIYKDFMPEDYSTAEAKTCLFYTTQSSKIC
jgi:hypothetical protein